jgi:CheY-like chemotaxis protein
MGSVMRLVVIDDNPADVLLIKEALRFNHIDARVSQFDDGRPALESLRQQRDPWIPLPSLVFLDLNMPHVHGFDVLKELRSTSETAKVPIAVLTSSQSATDIEHAEELGATRVLRKPTDLLQFFAVISNTVNELAR